MQLRANRRSVGRTQTDRGALLFFKGHAGARGCRIVDISHRGVRLHTNKLPALPLTFALTSDNFATVQRCRLVWRRGDSIGAVFETN